MATLGTVRLKEHTSKTNDEIYQLTKARIKAKSDGKDKARAILRLPDIHGNISGIGYHVVPSTFEVMIDGGFMFDIDYQNEATTVFVMPDCRLFI